MKNCLLTQILLLAILLANSQSQTVVEQKVSEITSWAENNPQEKAFVATDREAYVAGEPIWLKGWVLLEGKPSFLSRILYVTLTDKEGKVVAKKMYSLDKLASTPGVIDLDKNLGSGTYILSAFTLWMLNYPDYIFKKHLFIYGKDYRQPVGGESNTGRVLFFPEGGKLVKGVKTRIAFKAVNAAGLPIEANGAVYISNGEKIAELRTEHDGMGSFELTPKEGCKAKVRFGKGTTEVEVNLPPLLTEGVVMQVQNTSASRLFILLNRSETNANRYNKSHLLAQMNGVVVYKADFNIDEGASAASVPKKNLPAGIMQLALFDTAGTLLAERLVFIANQQVTPVNISGQVSTVAHGKNNVIVQADSLENPSLSLAVIDEPSQDVNLSAGNIMSNFLITSELDGYVHNPGYYLWDKQPATLGHLDLLLMTQQWRRYLWSSIPQSNASTLIYPVETYMNVRGKVTKTDRSAVITDGTISLITKVEDSTTILSTARLTDKGEFIVDSLFFKNKATVSYNATNNKKQNLPVDVIFYPAFIDTLKKLPFKSEVNLNGTEQSLQDFALSARLNKLISEASTASGNRLDTVLIKAKKILPLDSLQRLYVAPIFEISDQSLVIPENRSFINIWQYLKANVPGLNVDPFQAGGENAVSFNRHEGMTLDDAEGGLIKFFLNEIPVSADVIDALNPTDVALIKVYKGALSFALGADAGAISVYTKKGSAMSKAPFDKGFSKMEKNGFAFTREFYNPDYTLHPGLRTGEADNRTTLYWSTSFPNAHHPTVLVTVHNPDKPQPLRVIVQGTDENGKLVYAEKVIK